MNSRIAICLTSFLRDNLLYTTLQSIADFLPENCIVLIADQGYSSSEKTLNCDYFSSLMTCERLFLSFDCGLSSARNQLVERAQALNYDYCLITADSIQFTDKYDFIPYISFLESNVDYGIVGFNLNNRQAWEGELELILNSNFLVKQLNIETASFISYQNIKFYNCSVVRNFFLAKTQCLLDNRWDDDLKLCEHEDFFWRLKQTKWKVFYTDSLSARYVKSQNKEYNEYRQRMYSEFKTLLMRKYKLSGWVKQKH